MEVAMRYSGLGVRSVGPVGDFLDCTYVSKSFRKVTFQWMSF